MERTEPVKPSLQPETILRTYLQNEHNGVSDWEITIKDHTQTKKSLKQKEFYWCRKLKTYAPFGLDERDVHAVYYTR